MKTQISRFPDRMHRPFSGVYQQQGRMITDADWNAMAEIGKTRLDSGLDDVIGKGTPDQGGMVAGDETAGFSLVWGDAYVDGIRAEARSRSGAAAGSAFVYGQQLDFPDPPARPETAHMLYLDVWERSLTGLEDAILIDPGLHGADTTTRTRTMAQVKWAPQGFDAEDPAQNPPIGGGRLTLTLRQSADSLDECEPCADEIDLQDRVGNYLFRVEIHDVAYDAFGTPIRLVLKWSRENGAEAAAIGAEPPGFASSDWIYEFYDGAPEDAASESHLGYHHPDALAGWQPRRGTLTEGFPVTAPPGHSLVRRWDGYAELEKQGGSWVIAIGDFDGEMLPVGKDRNQRISPALGLGEPGHITEGPTILLSLDTMTVELELANHPQLAGDWWSGAVREAIHGDGDVILDDRRPMGIEHHYMCLAEVDGETLTLLDKGDCKRFRFPRLTDIHASDVCFDNAICEMPAVENVQEALDHLCQQRDLRWHNKHLHGWGIVCGLIVRCCPEGAEDDEDDRGPQDCVTVSKGYAIDCEGEDIVLDGPMQVDILGLVHEHDATAETPILDDGQGTACLVLDQEAGQPVIRVEPNDGESEGFLDGLLNGTLLGDFIQHCVLDLVKALTAALSFVDEDTLPEEPDTGDKLVSVERRKFISFANLAYQLIDRVNGAYVWLSKREHDILESIYNDLRAVMDSPTFCAMFQSAAFPPYPFPEAGTETYFGRNNHTRVKASPDGKRVYTYAGGDETINVYDTASGELVEIVRMPSTQGAEVTAIAISPDSRLLYAAASVKGVDTIFGIAQVGDKHVWESPMIVLCDLLVSELEATPGEAELIYAIGIGRGLFHLRPGALRDEAKPKPEPVHAFNAVGHMVIDPVTDRAFATAAVIDSNEPREVYNAFAVCPLSAGGSGTTPPMVMLTDTAGRSRWGRDDIAVKAASNPREASLVYLAVDGLTKGEDKDILLFGVPTPPGDSKALAQRAVENTQIALAFHPDRDELIAAFEDSFRLQTMSALKLQVRSPQIPVQVQPTDVTVGPKGDVYVQNFLSNTVTAIPAEDLSWTEAQLTALADYRYRVLLAFYALFGNIFQTIKDCFCDHLLVKCPECDGSERIYLACVEIRDNLVYNICNFGKRKYVQTFMAWTYWLSIVPVGAMMKQAIANACCAVFPNLLDQFTDNLAAPPPPPRAGAATGDKILDARRSRETVIGFRRTDFNAMRRERLGGLQLYGRLAGDAALATAAPPKPPTGPTTQSYRGASVEEAAARLGEAGVTVAETRTYDAAMAGNYLAEYTRTPTRIAKGSEAVIYERDGKVVFVAERPASAAAVVLDPEVQAKIADLEGRRAAVVAEVAALEAQVTGLQGERAAEEARLSEASASAAALQTEVAGLAQALAQAREGQAALKREIEGSRPVTEIAGVDREMSVRLAEAGIRTVADLAEARVPRLRSAGIGETADDRRRLIDLAKARLR